jgi:phosphogluconate 2-dehydrogenase
MSTMSKARRNVVVFRKIPDDLLERIMTRHDVTVADPRRTDELPRFREVLRDADGLIGSSFKLGEDELARSPRLRLISSISVGVAITISPTSSSAASACATHLAC